MTDNILPFPQEYVPQNIKPMVLTEGEKQVARASLKDALKAMDMLGILSNLLADKIEGNDDARVSVTHDLDQAVFGIERALNTFNKAGESHV